MPGKPWGIRSMPEIDSRYPLWDQPNFLRDVEEGRFYLPDAEEGKRETLVTSTIDAQPLQCLRLPGPSFIPLTAALTTGGFFIFGTFHWWWMALASLAVATGVICYWLWTGTAIVPEEEVLSHSEPLTLPAPDIRFTLIRDPASDSPGLRRNADASSSDLGAFHRETSTSHPFLTACERYSVCGRSSSSSVEQR